MQRKYVAQPTDPQAIRDIIQTISTGIPRESDVGLVKPINMDELKLAVHQGKRRKSPGFDGICLEFYQHTWDTTKHAILKILNQMYIDGEILDSQKKGVIVCILKKSTHSNPFDFRPLTPLNAKLKLFQYLFHFRQIFTDMEAVIEYIKVHESVQSICHNTTYKRKKERKKKD
jgi:hypothetical protein